MTNKITGFDPRPVQVGGKGSVERTRGKSADAPGKATAESAHVQLTDSAMQLAALEKAIAKVPDVDMERVEAVRNEIESGEYTVDSRRIADKLVQLERSLAASVPQG
jgi:negative regulator of flagellin synthesis FlgM